MSLPANHFLHLSRNAKYFDVSTVAATDYDVDINTGFMPPSEPVRRLPSDFEAWEAVLDRALGLVKLHQDKTASSADRAYAERWRGDVRSLPIISIESIQQDERQLRRAHVVLAYMMHMYIHSTSHDPLIPISIPPPVSIPIITVSRQLGIPPVLTYADTVLWNWIVPTSSPPPSPSRSSFPRSIPPTPSSISSFTSFTGTPDEDHFYMTSARIELRGVEALSLMRSSLNETFLGDAVAIRRITQYLTQLTHVINDITKLTLSMREGCEPHVFYHQVRPWFNGGSAHAAGWHFEGIEDVHSDEPTRAAQKEELMKFTKLAGPSAGQSSLIHALDAFLGVQHNPQPPAFVRPSASASTSVSPSNPSAPSPKDPTFLERQKLYMPRHHQAFLSYLSSVPKSVRALVLSSSEQGKEGYERFKQAYNDAIDALKRFRDGHIRIATLYIVTQARASSGILGEDASKVEGKESGAPRGTGGTALVPFLKGARDKTRGTALH